MTLSREENEMLTRVGPGTPAGELLRRYWLPVSVAAEVTPEQPTKFVKALGENLVLFRDTSGRVGLLADRCAHRGASLCYGRVEERGISCPYHGWLYDTDGSILETPPERNEAIMRSVRQPSYPVQKFIGLYWAYFGPEPAPVIPHYDVWLRQDGRRRIVVQPRLDCNWLQAMENSVDPAHLQILHQETAFRGREPVNTTRGFTNEVESFDFEVTPIGITKHRRYTNGHLEEHPLIFPNILRQGNATQIRVPMDDDHTMIFFVRFDPGFEPDDDNPPVEYVPSYKTPADKRHPEARFRWDEVQAQDHYAWETQGPIADRTIEHLAYSDRGVVLLRKLLKDNIEKVQRGEDPHGLMRDPKHALIDTQLSASLAEMQASGRLPALAGGVTR
jgi:5,5'-dehydrodivanillate O-demethylase oxygenase subunit